MTADERKVLEMIRKGEGLGLEFSVPFQKIQSSGVFSVRLTELTSLVPACAR
jgi:hypothetical protein